jgi:D-serine deaminase-like pyridoxal phosphate-dependent protein
MCTPAPTAPRNVVAMTTATTLSALDSAITAPRLPDGLETPCAVVDLDRLERNLARMQALADGSGVALRPHAKTHKSARVGALQLAAGARGLTVGTIGEAEVFADAGVDDLFLAYTVWTSEAKGRRLRDLHERVALRVGVDSPEGAEALGRALRGSTRPLDVLVELDSGGHRAGVRPEQAPDVARAADRAGLRTIGVYTHGGHSYAAPEAVGPAAADEVAAVSRAAEALRSAGFEITVLSVGSTPTASLPAPAPVTEIRPGTYAYQDRGQVWLGSCAPDDVAFWVATTVTSLAVPDQTIVDAGAKALSRDTLRAAPGLGLLPTMPGILRTVNDYHGYVDPLGAGRGRLGEILPIVPNHVCPVVDHYAETIVVRAGQFVDVWPVDARGRSG